MLRDAKTSRSSVSRLPFGFHIRLSLRILTPIPTHSERAPRATSNELVDLSPKTRQIIFCTEWKAPKSAPQSISKPPSVLSSVTHPVRRKRHGSEENGHGNVNDVNDVKAADGAMMCYVNNVNPTWWKKVGWETSIVSSNLIQAHGMLPGCITGSAERCLRHKISRSVHVHLTFDLHDDRDYY